MIIKISKHLWTASGNSNGNINATLSWILGYIDGDSKNINLINLISVNENDFLDIDIDDSIVIDITNKFGAFNVCMVSSLLIMGYILGGQE